MAQIVPEFQAEEVTGKFARTVYDIIEDVKTVHAPSGERKIVTRKIVPRQEICTEGVMFYFPQKHTLFVFKDDVDTLTRIGYFRGPRRVDMATGEMAPDGYTGEDLKGAVVAAEAAKRRTTGGLSELLGDDE